MASLQTKLWKLRSVKVLKLLISSYDYGCEKHLNCNPAKNFTICQESTDYKQRKHKLKQFHLITNRAFDIHLISLYIKICSNYIELFCTTTLLKTIYMLKQFHLPW